MSSTLARLLGLKGDESAFPWQTRLLQEHFSQGAVPEALDIPTGLGKTSIIAIWAAARAGGAKLPRRLVYVVDRRAVVDQATTEAERIRDVIEKDVELKQALGVTRSLSISTLRGQFIDNKEWLEDPSSPAIVVGTVDMIGSRLLFEGYRCSRKMRPYHAALLGADALIVLDEAHLVPAFEAMVRAATTDARLKAPSSNEHRRAVPASQIMSLSATGRGANMAFGLHDSDFEHPIVSRRLNASKRARVADPVESDALAETMAKKAWELTDGGERRARVLLFVDSRKLAQEVDEALHDLAKGDGSTQEIAVATELFVGGRRVLERQRAAEKLEALGLIAGSKNTPETPVFVIATSAGEVGVDLDADHAVLDLVEWERMVQRLGRVNRRGDGAANVWIVPAALDDKTEDALAKDEKIRAQRATDEHEDEDNDEDESEKPPKKLKEDERERVVRWRRREATARAILSLPSANGAHDASPRALTALKRELVALIEAGSTPAPLHPELTRAVVESWSMTSLEEHTGRPNIAPWIRGWVEEDAQTTVAWRTWLPMKRDAEAFFDAAPVDTAETLEQETTAVLDWLLKRVTQVSKRKEDARDASATDDDETETTKRPALRPGDAVMFVLGDHPRGWTLGELDDLDKREKDQLLRDITGGTVVVDARLGGLDDHGLLDPKVDGATDASERARLSFRVREVEDLEDIGDDEWRVEDMFVSRTNMDGEAVAWLVVETDPKQQSTTADGRSTSGREQRLDEHQAWAGEHARRIGERVGLRREHVELLELAAVLHDEGKKAERWQRAFRVPRDKRPLAKSTSRPIQSILAGYRHELGSLPFAERDPRVVALTPEDRDLVLHLIASHHGFARPILRTDGYEDAPPSVLVERARTIALRFARLEKRWGPWGLAWWEALLRAADQNASRDNDQRGGQRG